MGAHAASTRPLVGSRAAPAAPHARVELPPPLVVQLPGLQRAARVHGVVAVQRHALVDAVLIFIRVDVGALVPGAVPPLRRVRVPPDLPPVAPLPLASGGTFSCGRVLRGRRAIAVLRA